MSAVGRIRRSVHFVPGANDKMLEKSLATAADSLVLDLEDAVTPDNKESARRTVTDWLREVDFGRQERVVRINPFDTPWGRDSSIAPKSVSGSTATVRDTASGTPGVPGFSNGGFSPFTR